MHYRVTWMLTYVFADAFLKVDESGFTFLISMFQLAFKSFLQLRAVFFTGLAHCLDPQSLQQHIDLHSIRVTVVSILVCL